MGCFDGAEVCEQVGVYILHFLKTAMTKENAALYHDDGLGMLRNSSGQEIEWKPKQIIQIFKSCGLNITVKTNLKTVDFLDLRLDLINNTYQPYRKPIVILFDTIWYLFTSINIQTIHWIFQKNYPKKLINE